MGTAQAAPITFDFSWSSAGSTPTPAGASGSATGFFTINRMAGQAFTVAAVTSFSLTAMSTNIASYTINRFDNADFFTGTIAADGLSASLTDIFIGNSTQGFGCTTVACAGAGTVLVGSGGADDIFNFGNNSLAQQSFLLTAQTAVPAPSAMLLFGSGLAGLIGWQFRKKQLK